MPGVVVINNEKKKYSVYEHTSLISDKSYIGYTCSGIMERWKTHIRDVNQGKLTHFCNAIRKYGEDQWKHTVLFKTDDKNIAQQKEIELIKKYDTFNNGYNMTYGGDGGQLELLGGSYWMKGKTQEEIDKINKKKGRLGKDNPFYNKKHTKKSMDQMVDNRLKSGGGDYHHGKNPFTEDYVIEKCKEVRKKHGNWQGRIFTYKGKEYDAVWRFIKDFSYISEKNFRTLLKLNPVTLNEKLIKWYLKLRKMEQESEDTKYKKWLRRDVIDTSFGKMPVYFKWNGIKEELMMNEKEVPYARCS